MRLAAGASLVVGILLAEATAPWAAEAWYLLIPPRSEYDERADFLSGYKILDQEPLARWTQQSVYGSFSECAAVRDRLLMAQERVYSLSSEAYGKTVGTGTDSLVLNTQRFLAETNNADVLAFKASRCIRSDDPGLQR
jgi:hypothetical protein